MISRALASTIVCLLVLFRSAVFVFFEQAHFDSDQAIVGLMARDILTRQGFPVFFYGQQYLLAIEAWLTAPFVLVLGATVLAIKLPLLILNMFLAVLLVVRLINEAALTPSAALVAALFIVLPPPITASRLVEAGGGQIEPFVWVMLLWLLRGRRFWFGVVLAIGVLSREFTLYAPVALAIIAAAQRRLVHRGAVRDVLVVLGGIAVALAAVQLLIPFATNYFAAVRRPAITAEDVMAIPSRVMPFAANTLGVIFGARADALSDYNIRSSLHVGHPWLVMTLGIAAAVAVVRLPVVRRMTAGNAFAIYLMLVGLQAALAPLLLPESGGMLIRYALLALFLPVGAAAYYLRREPKAALRMGFLAVLAIWAGASAVDHGRLLREYVTRTPANTFRELTIYLERQGHRYGWADYWTAYHVTWLSDRRVVLAPYDLVRIPRDRDLVEQHRESAVRIQREPCVNGASLREWYICKN